MVVHVAPTSPATIESAAADIGHAAPALHVVPTASVGHAAVQLVSAGARNQCRGDGVTEAVAVAAPLPLDHRKAEVGYLHHRRAL